MEENKNIKTSYYKLFCKSSTRLEGFDFTFFLSRKTKLKENQILTLSKRLFFFSLLHLLSDSGIHTLISTQSPLSCSGTSSTASAMRSVRNNIDSLLLFQSTSRDLRNVLQNIFTGESYQFAKKTCDLILNNEKLTENPSDPRLYRPSVYISLNNASNRDLQFRTDSFNLYNRTLKPFVPLNFIIPRR